MNWIDEVPTDGTNYYWYRQSADELPEVVYVTNNGIIAWLGDGDHYKISDVVGQWQGPIKPEVE